MITRNFDLTLRIPEQDSIASSFKVVQNDNSVYRLTIRLTDGIDEIDYSQIDHATIVFLKADNNVVQGALTVGIDSLTYVIGTNEIAWPGTVLASVQLYGADSERLTTARFAFEVVRDLITPSVVESTTEFGALTKAIIMMEDLEGRLTDFPNIKVLGTYPTLIDLQTAHPSGVGLEGGYFVTGNGEFYIWSTVTNAWESLGTIKGPKGDPGPKGDKPAHQWQGTSLQLENPDGSWGSPVNLKGQDGSGAGDMLKSVYDTDNNGKVDNADNADTVGGFTVGVNVPANAKFTDTVTTVNNTLTSTSTTQALSAAQGKILKDAADTHKTESATLSALGHVIHSVLTATLNTTWTGSSAPFTKTQTVTGILATDTPIVDVVMSGTYVTDEDRAKAWSKIYRITTAANSITLYASEKPTVSLPIQLKVVR